MRFFVSIRLSKGKGTDEHKKRKNELNPELLNRRVLSMIFSQ
jgi:hypothetical protein